jgi:hypothetical protein
MTDAGVLGQDREQFRPAVIGRRTSKREVAAARPDFYLKVATCCQDHTRRVRDVSKQANDNRPLWRGSVIFPGRGATFGARHMLYPFIALT